MGYSLATKGFSLRILRIGVAVGILYYMLNRFLLTEVVSSIGSVKLNYVVTACIMSFLIQVIISKRLQVIAVQQGIGISVSRALDINLTAVFYGLFLPGKSLTGNAIRYYKLSNPDKKWAEALASILFDRVVATISLCTIGILFWIFDFRPSSVFVGLGMTTLLVCLFIATVLILDMERLVLLHKCLEKIDLPFLSDWLDRFLSSLRMYRGLGSISLVSALALSILAQLLVVFIYCLLARSLDINTSIFTLGWISSAVVLATMIPVSISGFGIREGALFLLLKPYGVVGEDVLALSFLVFGVTLLLVGTIGGVLEGSKTLSYAIRS
jgi:hypothetical protein